MLKKFLMSVLLCLLFVSNIMANNTSAKIEVNKNTAKIYLSSVPSNITAIQININNNINSTGTKFTPAKNFPYFNFSEKENGNSTNLIIGIDNKGILTSNGNLEIGTLVFSKKPKLNSNISIEFFNIDENLKPIIKNINTHLIVDGVSNSINNPSPETSTETTTESTTKKQEIIAEPTSETSTETTTKKQEKEFDINKEYPVIKKVKFYDIEDHWANDSIKFLAERGIINGVSDKEFLPNNNITRAEFIKLLAKLDNIEESKFSTNKFSDINPNAWYSPYIAWGVGNGIVNGISENIFAPNNSITREQMAVMLDRFINYKNFSLKENKEEINFIDSSNISSYALNSIKKMQKAGIINGLEDGSFAPKANATKAQAAKMLHILIINQ